MAESAEDQIKRLAEFIAENVPGEPSESEGAVDTAIRLLARYTAQPGQIRTVNDLPPGQVERFAAAIREATGNPGRTISVEGE